MIHFIDYKNSLWIKYSNYKIRISSNTTSIIFRVSHLLQTLIIIIITLIRDYTISPLHLYQFNQIIFFQPYFCVKQYFAVNYNKLLY